MRRLGPATLAVTLLVLMFGAGSAGATWSIVGVDPDTGEVGAAVASCVGSEVTVVPILVPGVGAGASQALLSSGSGEAFLEAMVPGADAQQVIDAVISADDQPDDRQFGAVMLDGSGAGWSGPANNDVAIDRRNADQTAASQGNILVDAAVVIRQVDEGADTAATQLLTIALVILGVVLAMATAGVALFVRARRRRHRTTN